MTRKRLQWPCAIGLALGVAMAAWPIPAPAQNVTFKIPSVKIPLKIKEQSLTITASALISMHSKDKETSIFSLQLTADLGELQQNITALLASQLDKEDACGERIAIEHADLTPVAPASLAVVQLALRTMGVRKSAGQRKNQEARRGKCRDRGKAHTRDRAKQHGAAARAGNRKD